MNKRRLPFVVAIAAAVAIGVPAVLGAEPAGSEKPGKGPKAEKGPQVEVTLNGTIERTTDEKGRPTFTLTADGTTYELSAGPKWWWAEAGGPLAAHVGDTVEIVGLQREGTAKVSVQTVDGEPIRAAGRPPWAGGPKVVGERHPGWKPWKADGHPGHGLGREGAPGQLKDEPVGDEEAQPAE